MCLRQHGAADWDRAEGLGVGSWGPLGGAGAPGPMLVYPCERTWEPGQADGRGGLESEGCGHQETLFS